MEKQTTKNDTVRSWRAMRIVFCWLCAIIAAIATIDEFYEEAYTAIHSKAVSAVYATGLTGDALMKAEDNISVNVPPTDYLPKGISLGILAGIGAYIGAWLFIIVIAFIWWFLLDRIREFMRAIRGQP